MMKLKCLLGFHIWDRTRMFFEKVFINPDKNFSANEIKHEFTCRNCKKVIVK